MARIPLVQIPNAPELPEPVLSHAPKVNVDLSDMARRAQQAPLAQGSFDAPAQALQAAGQAVADTGGLFHQLGRRLVDSRNQADLSRAEDIMAQARAAHEQDMLTLPEDQWTTNWDQHSARAVRQLQDLNVSPWVRSQIVPQYAHFDRQTRTATAYEAMRQTVTRDRQDIVKGYDDSLQRGDFDAARRSITRLAASGQVSKEGAQLMERQVQDASLRRGMTEATQRDPRTVQEDLDHAMRTGESRMFPEASHQPGLIRQYYEAARSLGNQREQDAYGNALNDLDLGVPADQVHQRYDSDLSPARRLILDKEMADSRPYDASVDGRTIAALRSDIAAYDGRTDSTLERLNALYTRIAGLPRDSRGPLRSELSQAWQSTAAQKKELPLQQRLRAEYLGEITRLGQSGALGDSGIPDVTQPLHYARAADLGVRIVQRQDELEGWAREHPTASRKEWSDKFREIVGPDAAAQAARALAPPWLHPLSEDQAAAPVDDGTVHFVQQLEGFTPHAHWDFRQVSVGYGTRAHSADEQLDEPTAALRLRAELAQHAERVDRAADRAGAAFTPNQRTALISFDFNTGKAPDLIRETLGDPTGLADRMKAYLHAGGHRLRGLAERRRQEIQLFQTP